MTDAPLAKLVRAIAQIRPIDRAGKAAVAQELRNLRGRLLPEVGQEVADLVEAAALLMHFAATSEDAPPETPRLVARLVAPLRERHFAATSAAPASPVPPALGAGGTRGLGPASKLGDVMVQTGMITPAQLEEGLEFKKVWRLPLGTCLEKLGHVTGLQVARALESLRQVRAGATEEPAPPMPGVRRELRLDVRDGTGPSLAEFLLQRGHITPQQLEKAQTLQRAAGVLLGEALTQVGALTRDQVKTALQAYERQRK